MAVDDLDAREEEDDAEGEEDDLVVVWDVFEDGFIIEDKPDPAGDFLLLVISDEGAMVDGRLCESVETALILRLVGFSAFSFLWAPENDLRDFLVLVTAEAAGAESFIWAGEDFPVDDAGDDPLETAQGFGSNGRKAGLIGTKCEPVAGACATEEAPEVAEELEALAAADVACPVWGAATVAIEIWKIY